MQKAGGIIALVAGIFGILAAIVTLSVGGVGSAFNAEGAGTVVGLGWGGMIFSFLTIILGAICIGTTSRVPGLFLVGCALAGAVLGGTFVAVFMVLALVGGILAMIGTKPAPKAFDTPSGDATNVDEIIARHLQKERAHEAVSAPVSRPQGPFGKRGAA